MGTISAWRITSKKYRNEAFTGKGAKEYGGRFNSVGTPVVYTAESLALATLELLANINKKAAEPHGEARPLIGERTWWME